MASSRVEPGRKRALVLPFGLLGLCVYAFAILLAGRLAGLDRPAAVAAGLTLDLTVTVPLAFYLLVARRRSWPVVSVVPLAVLGALVAGAILPAERQQTLRVLEALAIPLELGVVAWIGWRAAGAWRSARSEPFADPCERLRRASREVVGLERVAEVLATELAVLYYGLAAWRAPVHAPAGRRAVSQHVRSSHGAILLAVLLLLAVEGLALHVLIARWSGLAAWLATLASLYTALWLVADYRATVLRPLLLDDESLWLRAGLRWSVRVPRAEVTAVTRRRPEGERGVALTFLAAPTVWLTLAHPVTLRGPYGLRRRTRVLGLAPDEPLVEASG